MVSLAFIIALVTILSSGNVQSSRSQLPTGLIQQKTIRDCGVIYGYNNDSACFMEHLETGEMIHACESNLYDPSSCGCTKQMPQNYRSNPECEKARQQGAFYLESSSKHIHSSMDNQKSSVRHTRISVRAGCESNRYYAKLLRFHRTGMQCTSLDEVIEDLYQLVSDYRYYSCLSQLITSLLNQTSKTSDICSCDSSRYYFQWPSLDSDTGRRCLSQHKSYYTLLSKYYSSYGYYGYHSYHHLLSHSYLHRECVRLSDALSLLNDINDPGCERSVIYHLRATFHNVSSSHKCNCRSLTSVYTCNKTEMVRALSKHSSVDHGNYTHLCSDKSHVKSEAVPITFCGVSESSRWTQGLNVYENCKSLPKYIAVASFVNGVYPGDGKAGILISCNTTAVTIVTQQCDGGLKLEHIKKGTNTHYTDMPGIYYTIKSSYLYSMFG